MARSLAVLIAAAAAPSFAQTFTVDTPVGPIELRVSHAGPSGALASPDTPQPTAFRPPSVFSAPLPSGSGARALGLAGAFTAVADDATAASWNPAGLINLETPEASAVYRLSLENNAHHSSDSSLEVGDNDFSSHNLNYLSFVYPFYMRPLERNLVVSLNYQEAYDFTSEFSANLSQTGGGRSGDRTSGVFEETQVDAIDDGITKATVTSFITTETVTTFDQVLSSGLLSDLDFEQEGVIAAFTPSFAVEVTPKLALGASFNYYFIDPSTGDSIRSRTLARYSGRSTSSVDVRTTQTSSGTFTYEGVSTLPPSGSIPFPIDIPFSGEGEIEPFTDSDSSRRSDTVEVDGTYEEINEFTDLEGYNFTLGLLYTLNRLITVGAAVDLPWTAETRQKKTTRNTLTTFNDSRTRVLDVIESEDVLEKDVEFDFPLYWAAGILFRWTQQFYTSFDLSQTLWSDFAFQAEGDPKINPLDGSLHSENPLDDTWAARVGSEYLIILPKTEIPIRVGAGWEERPAIGSPDDYYSVSLGTGISIGQEPHRTFIDFAYIYTWADDVGGIVADQPGLSSDVEEHQGFVSVIQHF